MTSSGARHVGNIASIITGTVAEVTREIGEWITDAIEMNEAAEAARKDAAVQRVDDDLDYVADEADVSYDAEVEPATEFVEAEVVEPEAERPR
ncbi:hypothetical protein [Nocardia sp. NBC_00565]|uniref:hypothetical protein n=1 Tax=Nocardia sp. NBC_00565 TaxID=2975993 RepID=UPI002E8170A3|nr:hypothetical protein [Nocardia sp. NBC_00565]